MHFLWQAVWHLLALPQAREPFRFALRQGALQIIREIILLIHQMINWLIAIADLQFQHGAQAPYPYLIQVTSVLLNLLIVDGDMR